jgi:hypothetical protein
MKGIMTLQLYLLSQMRATDLVDAALIYLNLQRGDLDAAVDGARAHGLELPGHDMELYSELLGYPPEEERVGTEGSNEDVQHLYRLPLWSNLRFAVLGDRRRQTSGLSFAHLADRPRIDVQAVGQLLPWHMLDSDLDALLATGEVVHEWYPQKDYACLLPDQSSGMRKWYVLQFDFCLLQAIVQK